MKEQPYVSNGGGEREGGSVYTVYNVNECILQASVTAVCGTVVKND